MDERLQTLINKIKKDKDSNDFINNNKIDEETIKRSFVSFVTFAHNNEICKECHEGSGCNLEYKYMKSSLAVNGNTVDLVYNPCEYENSFTDFLQTIYFPKIENINDKELYDSEERAEALSYIMQFLDNTKGKGVYLHGEYGTGKTFIFYKIASTLASQKYKVILAYYPDLVRFLKSCISDGTLEKEINRLKKVDVLMLDDIGGENNSAYVRDEILCPILQYRLLEGKAVCMTSNCDLDLLRKHFMETKDEVNKMASDRIIERIKALMNVVELKGKTYRN